MRVEASELMSEAWTQWQGHVIHDVFPLGRYLGCSDHSGVFLTKSAVPGPSEVAIKLVPAGRALAEALLPRWKRACRIVHPHLLRLLQSGGCQLDGQPYLYVVMEYADQTLAQVLQGRSLTEDEAREMLRPTLDALAFLHGLDLVQGALKPANILVVGDQLKLACDTIHRATEDTISAKAPTVYDPPEALHGSSSTAGDIWALGVCLFEALTRRPPPLGRGERGEAVALPSDFSPALRGIVARCLSPSPQNRPSVTELADWARGQPAGPAPDATIQPAAIVPPAPTTPQPTPPRITRPAEIPETARLKSSTAPSAKPPALLAAALGGVVIVALGWTGMRLVRAHRSSAPLPAAEGSLSQVPGATAAMTADVRTPASTVLPPKPSRSGV